MTDSAEPPKKTERVIIPLEADLLRRIDNFRFGERMESRAAAMRRLFEIGLSQAGYDADEKK